MKLCFLAAANSIHSHRWVRYFAGKGHEVHWISLVPFDEKPADITCYDLSGGSKWAGFLRAALQIRGLVGKIGPDIVHAHYAGTYGALGMLSGFRPYVLTAWGSDVLFVGRSRLRGLPVRRALQSANLITCDAFHMVDALCKLGVDRAIIKIVYFGIDADKFSPGEPDPEILARWGATDRPVVISLRNFAPVYNIELLIKAVPHIVQSFPKVLVVIFGTGELETELKRLAVDLGVEGNVLFAGRYANSDLPRILRSADVYVSTSLSDAGIAASTAEAMGCGVPVVVTNTGENDKWIDHGRSGFLVGTHDQKQLASRVVDLLTSESERASLGHAGRQVIVERNNYAREMDRMNSFYETLASGKNLDR